MTKAEARRYVYRVLAAEARHHIGNDSEWLRVPLRSDGVATEADGEFTAEDQRRIIEAVHAVADGLERRSVKR